ncbi:MAG: FAD-binding oxidoreductase [Gomphosphaeria aponina SAG 52.96 = DSM 107014]|uniref:FAD-binding oxidoreductase n=1 Tax=Gomphosphaeria aponina SAG 52.96 = DSM 107014 TaxID=1521640 RepID=A0A941JLV8_9CHRO|nr:FAD-binding oxidoreductase [Gomphosphaeria aponina SAG 52.96 = DSM 107014]
MKQYNWIVIGGGITGSALAYELQKKGFSVLLLEKDLSPKNATLYSYGGLAYWSGTTKLTRQLCQEGIDIHRHLSEELDGDTEFRELDLILTINPEDDPQEVAAGYEQFAIAPRLLDLKAACELEPLLNPKAIAAVLQLPHGHIHPDKTNQAYGQAYQRLGGEMKIESVVQLLQEGEKFVGVKTPHHSYYADNTVCCAGGLSRSLLQKAGITVKIYFTHAQLIKIPPTEVKLKAIVMPAQLQRLSLEAAATQMEQLWEQPSQELVARVMEAGAVQFKDGSLCLGQSSQIITAPEAEINLAASEAEIRTGVGKILPALATLPGNCHTCLVTFAHNSLPLVGAVGEGIYLFNGFTSTLVFAPPLARHFAHSAAQGEDEVMSQLTA